MNPEMPPYLPESFGDGVPRPAWWEFACALLAGWFLLPFLWHIALSEWRWFGRLAHKVGATARRDTRDADHYRSIVLRALEQAYPDELQRMKDETARKNPGYFSMLDGSYFEIPHPSTYRFAEWQQQRYG